MSDGPEMTVFVVVCLEMAGFNSCCPVFFGLIGLYNVEWCPECNMFLGADSVQSIDGALLGIWNLTMPYLSDATYERRILGLVVSLEDIKSDGSTSGLVL